MANLKTVSRVVPLLVLAATALAQGNRVCMAGNLEHMSAPQLHACQTLVQHVRDAAAQFHTPPWHFVVVCDEAGWKDYAAFSNKSASVLENTSADTNVTLRTTFFRGSHLTSSFADKIVAAELSSIAHAQSTELASN